jgi:hypothetical protein
VTVRPIDERVPSSMAWLRMPTWYRRAMEQIAQRLSQLGALTLEMSEQEARPVGSVDVAHGIGAEVADVSVGEPRTGVLGERVSQVRVPQAQRLRDAPLQELAELAAGHCLQHLAQNYVPRVRVRPVGTRSEVNRM